MADPPPSDEARLARIIESAMDAIITVDAAQRVVLFNPAAEQMFGCSAAEALGQPLDQFLPAAVRQAHRQHVQQFGETSQTVRRMGELGEITGVRKNGEAFPIEASISHIKDPDPHYTAVLRDINERKRLERHAREQASLAHLGHMAARVAHEVKNPLAGVQGVLQILHGRSTLSERDKTVITQTRARLENLTSLLNDVLVFARPPRLTLAPTSVPNLLTDLVSTLSTDPALQHVQVQLSTPALPRVVQADAKQLERMFSNLLLNAAQAMNGTGTLAVAVQDTHQHAEVTIRDTGPGIPDDIKAHIFDPFFTTKTQGTGLGLAISKQVVETHCGTVTVDCPSAGGTLVTVALPHTHAD